MFTIKGGRGDNYNSLTTHTSLNQSNSLSKVTAL